MNNNVQDPDMSKIVIMIDLDSKKSYMSILNQIKDLGMTKTRYHYVLATLGIYELDLNDFRHGGVTITGFSIVDYYSINTIKYLSDLVQSGEPLNKIANIPVNFFSLSLSLSLSQINLFNINNNPIYVYD